MEPYAGVRHVYECGREYVRHEPKEFLPTLLVVVDSKDAAVGITNGERIEVLWSDSSYVRGKHHMGGSSQMRFNRGRKEEVKSWLRKVAGVVVRHSEGRDLVVGGAGMTKDEFLGELPAAVRARVREVRSVGYTDENGLWELMRMHRYV